AVPHSWLFRSGPLTSLNMDTGATASGEIDSCTTGLVADGKTVHVTHGPILSNGVLLPVARLQEVDERTLSAAPSVFLGARSPMFPAVDSDHGVLVVAFLAGDDFELNSNAACAGQKGPTAPPPAQHHGVELSDIDRSARPLRRAGRARLC